ncbi:TAT-variant-translocated molybdopterin oxidoreductase [soil metagenome]
MIDQCPTSAKEGKPAHTPRAAHELVGASGQAYYRGLDDLADTPGFRDFLEREFPAGASELLSSSRRTFLKLMGAGVALAGAASLPGCRRPDHKIMPYSKNPPEDVIAGRPLYYATAMALPGGGAEGLLIETHEGRPTKVEGNPLHPINQGKSSVHAQASVLNMYDPDRLKEPVMIQDGVEAPAGWPFIAGWARDQWRGIVRREAETDEGFAARKTEEERVWQAWNRAGHFNKFDATQGAGLMFVVPKVTSPTRDALRDQMKAKWPQANWVVWDSIHTGAELLRSGDGASGASAPVLDLNKANVVVSFDKDFLHCDSAALSHARAWGATRRIMHAGQSMCRLYVVESSCTITGSSADHRLRLAPSRIGAVVAAIAQRVLMSRAATGSEAVLGAMPKDAPALSGEALAYAEEIARDLLDAANLGKSALLCGPTQPAWVHALVASANAALGNTAVTYRAVSGDEAVDTMAALRAARDVLNAGKVDTLVCMDVNPAYDAPGDIDFAAAMLKAPHRVVLSSDWNETAALATVRLNGAHYLEAWGDVTAADGTVTLQQPMIAPLYDGRSAIEVLALLAGLGTWVGYDLVRRTWQVGDARPNGIVAPKREAVAAFDKAWRRALHDGVMARTDAARNIKPAAPANPGTTPAAQPRGDTQYFGAAAPVPAPTYAQLARTYATKPPETPAVGNLDVVFTVGHMGDGRWANNAWIQELSEPASKMVWDNAAFVSPRTAEALGVMQSSETDKKPCGRMVDLAVDGRRVRMPVWAVPGMPDDTLALPLGYGRRKVGLVGAGAGFDVNPLRSSASPAFLTGVGLSKAADGQTWYEISVTQAHGSMEGRAIVREIDKPAYDKFADTLKEVKFDVYGRPVELSLGERLEGGEFNHMPAPVPIYKDPYRDAEEGYNPSRSGPQHATPGLAAYDTQPQWGMTIDLSTCIGCNVCTIACQAENNIAVVGKAEVNKGREMAWIRVDRYFKGDMDASDGTVFQPVACVHCEAAPCEVVCPVNATVHGSEGHNFMVYNRCIGTRYCANNCPYKVRRFNFFDYGVVKFQGGLKEALEDLGGSTVTDHLPANHNLIPPRLRKQLDEISKMQKNPNVTVRSRGVMEKCTYCIQRTNEAKIDYKLATGKRPEDFMPDGLVQTACQQACPTGAITFGNILDKTGEYADASVDGNPAAGAGTTAGRRKGSLVRQMREHTRSYLLLGYLATRPRTSHMIRVNNPNLELLSRLGKKARLERMAAPFGEATHGGHGEGGHGGGEHDEQGGPGHDKNEPVNQKHSTFMNPRKAGRDGYVLSLNVLSTGGRA